MATLGRWLITFGCTIPVLFIVSVCLAGQLFQDLTPMQLHALAMTSTYVAFGLSAAFIFAGIIFGLKKPAKWAIALQDAAGLGSSRWLHDWGRDPAKKRKSGYGETACLRPVGLADRYTPCAGMSGHGVRGLL